MRSPLRAVFVVITDLSVTADGVSLCVSCRVSTEDKMPKSPNGPFRLRFTALGKLGIWKAENTGGYHNVAGDLTLVVSLWRL